MRPTRPWRAQRRISCDACSIRHAGFLSNLPRGRALFRPKPFEDGRTSASNSFGSCEWPLVPDAPLLYEDSRAQARPEQVFCRCSTVKSVIRASGWPTASRRPSPRRASGSSCRLRAQDIVVNQAGRTAPDEAQMLRMWRAAVLVVGGVALWRLQEGGQPRKTGWPAPGNRRDQFADSNEASRGTSSA